MPIGPAHDGQTQQENTAQLSAPRHRSAPPRSPPTRAGHTDRVLLHAERQPSDPNARSCASSRRAAAVRSKRSPQTTASVPRVPLPPATYIYIFSTHLFSLVNSSPSGSSSTVETRNRSSDSKSRRRDGAYQADRPQVHRRQGPQEAARHQGCEEVGSDHRRREETPPLQARDGGAPRDPQVPEEHRAADPQAALPAARPRDRPGLQDRPAVPEPRRAGPPGGGGGLPRRPLRGHKPVRHPRQARHHHAQGHPARPPHPWRTRLESQLIPPRHQSLMNLDRVS